MALVTGVPDRRSRPFRINAVITPAVHDHTHATSYTSSAERFLCSRISSSSTGFAAHHERPGRAGHLVGERDRDDLERSPCQHLCDPGKLPWMKLGAAHHRDRADDKQSSQVAVALLGDRAELGLAPVDICRGTSPIQAAKSRPDRKILGFVTVAAMADAPISPMPGTVWIRLLSLLARCGFTIRFSIAPIIVCKDWSSAANTTRLARASSSKC